MNRAYLLLDAVHIPDLHLHLLGSTQFIACHPLYLNTAYADLADCGPLLVPVVTGSPLADTFAAKWRNQAGIWLETDAPETMLLDHLRSLIHVGVENDVTVFFRYYDPRITRLWLEDLPLGERDRLMGPVQLIRLPANDGSDLLIQRSKNPSTCQHYAATPWLRLSAAQLQQLAQAQRQQFDRHLIEHCQRYFPAVLQGLDAEACQAWVQHCTRCAEQYGYTNDDQVTRWLSLHAHLGNDFPNAPQHSAYRKILEARSATPQHRLDQLLNELNMQLIRATENRS